MKQPDILKITRKAAILKEKKAQQQAEQEQQQPALDAHPILSPPSLSLISPQPEQPHLLESREWWSQRWIDVLESFGWRRRLERARNYVREGRVLSLEFHGNKVAAHVQGTAPEPYHVQLFLDPFTSEQWQFVIEAMAAQALFVAKLLAGEMPPTLEEVFIASGLSLFPLSKFDIHSHCDCPDPVNPCKHIGAVYYLLGEHFSQDPFILFQLRGKTKAELIQKLRELRSGTASVEETSASLPSRPTAHYTPPPTWPIFGTSTQLQK